MFDDKLARVIYFSGINTYNNVVKQIKHAAIENVGHLPRHQWTRQNDERLASEKKD